MLNRQQFRETMLARDLVNIPSLKHQGEWKDTPYKDLPGVAVAHHLNPDMEVPVRFE